MYSSCARSVHYSYFFRQLQKAFAPNLRTPSMCRHILNAQVSVRASCCKQWFDCPECHAETQDHDLAKSFEMVLACKKCKKVFRKDTRCVSRGLAGRKELGMSV